MPRLLHIATIANDQSVYAAMRASMASVGFTEDRCRFTLFDNSHSNQYEPYAVLRQLATDGNEPYVLLCHQDLLFSEECSYAVLEQQLKTLEKQDLNWAVAGTSGGDIHGQLILNLDDPVGKFRAPDLPREVISLDENLLVLPRWRYTLPSPDLSGFHLYAADLCLNAYLQGRRSYVIDFPVHHLSGGNAVGPAFLAAMDALCVVWSKRLLFAMVRTPCAEIRIPPFKAFGRFLRGGRVKSFLRRHGVCRVARPFARKRVAFAAPIPSNGRNTP